MVQPVDCRGGEILTIGEGSLPLVYFPETLIACLSAGDRNISIGMIGREGMVGWGCLTASGMDHQACVELGGGTALAVRSGRLRAAVAVSPSLALTLLGFVQTFTMQMGQRILCSRITGSAAQVSAWLLMFHDRVDGDEIAITHLRLGSLLKLGRGSITDALHVLEGERVICCTRGRTVVRNRALLETLAGSFYGPAESIYRAAIGPFGKLSVPSP